MANKKIAPVEKKAAAAKKKKGETQPPDPRGIRYLVIRNNRKVWEWR